MMAVAIWTTGLAVALLGGAVALTYCSGLQRDPAWLFFVVIMTFIGAAVLFVTAGSYING